VVKLKVTALKKAEKNAECTYARGQKIKKAKMMKGKR
jgi:hypothetical protein